MRLYRQSLNLLEKTFKRGFFHLLSVTFLVQFLGFGTSLLVTKFLSPEDFGKVKIIQSYAVLFWILAGCGLNSAVLKFCSEDRPHVERESILRFALARSLFTIAGTLVILAVLSFSGIIVSTQELAKWFVIYALVIPFGVFTDILITYLQSEKRIKEMARAQGIIKTTSFVFIVVLTWLFGLPGFVFATIAAYIVGLIPLLRQVGFPTLKNKLTFTPAGFWGIAIFSVLANGVGTLRQYGDIFILDHFSQNRVEIGFYSLATIFVLAATQVINTVQSISTPYFAERAKDRAWFRKKLIQTQLQAIGLSFVVALGVYILAWLLIRFFYGPSYQSTLVYLAILLIKYIVWSACAIIGVALFSLGQIKYNFIASLVAALSGLYLSYYFLIHTGIAGTAWAQVISTLINFILSVTFILFVLRWQKNDTPR